MKVRHALSSLAAVLAVLSIAAPALAGDEACHLSLVTKVDMSIDASGRVNVPMRVSGQTMNMLIDTGGVSSMLTEQAADAAGLHPEAVADNVRIVNFGGYVINRFVRAQGVEFGDHLRAPWKAFLILPDKMHMGTDIQGILGPEILRAYDDEFDFANGKFSLFEPSHCDGNLVYWTDADHAEIPFTMPHGPHIIVDVELDGQKMQAILDTGASNSILDLESAESLFGFDEKSPLLKKLGQTADGYVYKYPFKKMSIGGVIVDNPDIVLRSREDIKAFGDRPRMLVGISILRQLHLYISYRQQRIVATPASAH